MREKTSIFFSRLADRHSVRWQEVEFHIIAPLAAARGPNEEHKSVCTLDLEKLRGAVKGLVPHLATQTHRAVWCCRPCGPHVLWPKRKRS
jgi:hypothetical protein